MITSKNEFIKRFLPEGVSDIDYTQINLDVTDLSLSDILRNLNTLYPKNSKNRMRVENGDLIIGVLCRAESLHQYNGVFLMIGNGELNIEIASSSYIILSISEERITSEDKLEILMNDILSFLISQYSDSMGNLPDFYKKFVYNESELYKNNSGDDYHTSDY